MGSREPKRVVGRRIVDPSGLRPAGPPLDTLRMAVALERIADVLEWQRARAERGSPSSGPR